MLTYASSYHKYPGPAWPEEEFQRRPLSRPMPRHRRRQPGFADGEMQHGGADGTGKSVVLRGGIVRKAGRCGMTLYGLYSVHTLSHERPT